MENSSPFEKDVWLKGEILVIVRGQRDGRPRVGQQVVVYACGFV
jgi:hypothetical protein